MNGLHTVVIVFYNDALLIIDSFLRISLMQPCNNSYAVAHMHLPDRQNDSLIIAIPRGYNQVYTHSSVQATSLPHSTHIRLATACWGDSTLGWLHRSILWYWIWIPQCWHQDRYVSDCAMIMSFYGYIETPSLCCLLVVAVHARKLCHDWLWSQLSVELSPACCGQSNVCWMWQTCGLHWWMCVYLVIPSGYCNDQWIILPIWQVHAQCTWQHMSCCKVLHQSRCNS